HLFSVTILPTLRYTLFPYTTLFRSPKEWDAMPNESIPEIQDPKIVHYNLFFKPWHFADVQYGHYFWDVAKTTPYYDELKQQLDRSEEHTSELQSRFDLVCRLLLEKK